MSAGALPNRGQLRTPATPAEMFALLLDGNLACG